MAKDEEVTAEGEQQEENAEDTQNESGQDQSGQEEESESEDEDEGYRAKLNATNRFLEREGYEWKDGKWQKKPQAAPQQQETDTSRSQQNEALSPKDLHALNQANVHLDDFDEVVKMAKVLDMPVHKALQEDVVKTVLEKRATHRKTAQAANIRPARPAAHKPTDAEVLEKASKGEVPEKGSDEAETLFWARRGGKRS